MYEPTDQDVLHCLAAMKVDPEHAGANNAADRLLLLHKALQRVQSLGRVPLKAETDGSGKVVDPSAFPKISSRGKLVAKEFDGEKAYSMQESMAISVGSDEISTAWFELRRTICNMADNHVENGVKRFHLMDTCQPHEMAGFIDILAARTTADGNLPLLETRHRFYYSKQVTPEYAAAEQSTSLAHKGPHDNLIIDVEHDEMKLLAILMDMNAGLLSPEYIASQKSAWGTGDHFKPSFILPLEPLTADVKLPLLCKVCNKETTSKCSGCKTVSYCSKECQTQDWREHKQICKQHRQNHATGGAANTSTDASASQPAASSSSNSNSVIVKLGGEPMAPYTSTLPTNTSRRKMHKVAKQDSGPKANLPVDPTKKLLVKIQAPLPSGFDILRPSDMVMPLLLYDEKRKLQTCIQHGQQAPGTYNRLLQAVRQHGVMGGAKAYFWATLEAKDRLVISVDPLPSQTHSW